MNDEAARQLYERRDICGAAQARETIVVADEDGIDQEQRDLRIGVWIGNQRSRVAALSPEGVEQLAPIGTRWA